MSDKKEGATWKSRKQAIKDKYYATLKTIASGGETPTTPESPGTAATPAVSLLDPSAWGVDPAPSSSATSVTVTESATTPSASPESTTPAESTKPSSVPSMVWMVAPVGFTEHSMKQTILGPNGSLLPGLEPATHASLVRLATARNERVEDTVQQIAEFFVEEEDERSEGTLKDAVEFYITQYARFV